MEVVDPHLIVVEKGISEPASSGRAYSGAVVVRRLSRGRERVPGGNETIEGGVAEGYQGRRILKVTTARHVVNRDLDAPGLISAVEEAAEEVQRKFRYLSRVALDQSNTRRPRTLVTVIRYSIHVRAKGLSLPPRVIRAKLENEPEFFQGFEVQCAFAQVVRQGVVKPDPSFEIRSWTGEMPIRLPRDQDIRRIVDIGHHIAGAQRFMDRAEAGEVTHREDGTDGNLAGDMRRPRRVVGPSSVPRLGQRRDD